MIGQGAGRPAVGVIGDSLDMVLDRTMPSSLGGRGNNRDVAVARPSMSADAFANQLGRLRSESIFLSHSARRS